MENNLSTRRQEMTKTQIIKHPKTRTLSDELIKRAKNIKMGRNIFVCESSDEVFKVLGIDKILTKEMS